MFYYCVNSKNEGGLIKMAIKIMIADDHSMIREGLKSLLELEGDIQVVAEAEDGSVLGYLITASSTEGYNGLVQISVGITSEGNLTAEKKWSGSIADA